MNELEEKFNLYLNDELRHMLEALYHRFPQKYDSLSHVLRVAIIKLYKEEFKT